MAKQIKAIKCPQCGSIKKTEIGKDTYKCNDCGSSYFLDSDDVNINIYEQNTPYSTPPRYINRPPQKPKAWVFVVVICISVFTMFILPWIISSLHKHDGSGGGVYSSGSSYSRGFRIDESLLIDNPTSNNPMAFIIDDRDDDGYYAVQYDLNNQKIVKEKKLKDKSKKSASHSIRKCFDAWYVQERVDESYIVYKVDPVSFVFENLGDKLAAEFPELAAGIATIKMEHYIDAFELMTNDGDEYCYSAYSNKLYKDDREVKKDKSIPTHTTYYYGFTNGKGYSSCKNGDKVQLVQLKSVSQNRTLKDYSLKWGYGCKFEAQWFNGDYTFVKDVTPERKYFGGSGSVINDDKPRVMFWNDKSVFVLLKASANPAATYNIQSIDVETGNLNWSVETPWKEELRIVDFEEYKDFYVLNMRQKGIYYFFTIDKNNPSLESINLPQYRR